MKLAVSRTSQLSFPLPAGDPNDENRLHVCVTIRSAHTSRYVFIDLFVDLFVIVLIHRLSPVVIEKESSSDFITFIFIHLHLFSPGRKISIFSLFFFLFLRRDGFICKHH